MASWQDIAEAAHANERRGKAMQEGTFSGALPQAESRNPVSVLQLAEVAAVISFSPQSKNPKLKAVTLKELGRLSS